MERSSDDANIAQETSRDMLTLRQVQILRCLRANMSPKEIACYLIVTEATVRTHIRNAIKSLGVHGYRAAVRTATRLHLLDDDSIGMA